MNTQTPDLARTPPINEPSAWNALPLASTIHEQKAPGPGDPADPVAPEPIDPVDPEPVDPVEPTDPVDKIPVDPKDPTKPIGPSESADVSSAGS